MRETSVKRISFFLEIFMLYEVYKEVTKPILIFLV